MKLEKAQLKEEHLLVKKYLEDHSLVESNIISFNNFIDHRMQEIVDELNDSLPIEDIEIKLGKIHVDRPQIIEADGSSHLVTPTEARIRGLTYSAPIHVEITIKQAGQLESHTIEIGQISVIVKSNVSNLSNLSKDQL